MKHIAVFLLAASSLFAGELRGRFQSVLLDVQADSITIESPDMPGLGQSEYVVFISIKSVDPLASGFTIYARVKLEDGSLYAFRRYVERNPLDGPVVVGFSTGPLRPVSWAGLHVTREHPEPADLLVPLSH